MYKRVALFALIVTTASACSSSSEHDEYRVIRKSDSDGKQMVIALGDDARMSCQTNVPWKRCVWKPPRNGVRDVSTLNQHIEIEYVN